MPFSLQFPPLCLIFLHFPPPLAFKQTNTACRFKSCEATPCHTLSVLLCLQAGRRPSGSNAASGQHPAGPAAPAAAVRAESLRRPGARAATPGSAAAQVPHRHLQVWTVNTKRTKLKKKKKKRTHFFSSSFCLLKELVQRGRDRHLFLHQSHHHHDNTIHSAGATPPFLVAVRSVGVFTEARCFCAAQEPDQREGDGRPESGGGVCPSRLGLLREPLRPVPQLEAPNVRVNLWQRNISPP